MLRNRKWLENQLELLLKKYFGDLTISTPIEIKFGREAKYRFGSIRLFKGTKGIKSTKSIKGFMNLLKARDTRGTPDTPQKSIITITSMFAKPNVPLKVVEYTICHELCHYAHGFSSSNRRLFKFPHHGGVVNAELTRRGAGDLIVAYKRWLKTYRQAILKKRVDLRV